jgi:hypothetical protein
MFEGDNIVHGCHRVLTAAIHGTFAECGIDPRAVERLMIDWRIRTRCPIVPGSQESHRRLDSIRLHPFGLSDSRGPHYTF